MIIQKRDGSLLEDPAPFQHTNDYYYAEVAHDEIEEQGSLVERIISMAFDVLGARHLEVRVHGQEDA